MKVTKDVRSSFFLKTLRRTFPVLLRTRYVSGRYSGMYQEIKKVIDGRKEVGSHKKTQTVELFPGRVCVCWDQRFI